MPDLYAFDLSSCTGWARFVDGHVTSGVRRLAGTRAVRARVLRNWRTEFIPAGTIAGGVVAYEKPHFRGYAATLSACALVVALEERAETLGLQVIAVHTATLKKHATGSGRATKEGMIAAARNRWPRFDPETDDEADARHVLAWAADQAKVVLPCE